MEALGIGVMFRVVYTETEQPCEGDIVKLEEMRNFSENHILYVPKNKEYY